jgi:hypothetical protein
LHLSDATQPIPDYDAKDGGGDPYQIVQVHDYKSVRFLRMDPSVRAASTSTIKLFQAHYPELLSRKYFVNVPLVMGWFYAAMKAVVATATMRKLTMLSYGESLVNELSDAIPAAYGGKAEPLEAIGETVRLERKEDLTQEQEKTADAMGGKGSAEVHALVDAASPRGERNGGANKDAGPEGPKEDDHRMNGAQASLPKADSAVDVQDGTGNVTHPAAAAAAVAAAVDTTKPVAEEGQQQQQQQQQQPGARSDDPASGHTFGGGGAHNKPLLTEDKAVVPETASGNARKEL